MAIQTPPAWIADHFSQAAHDLGNASAEAYWHRADTPAAAPIINHIGLGDLRDAMRLGLQDFAASRTDVFFLCLFYPVIGLVLGRMASGYGLVPLLFPLVSGFALIGPFAAIGLNEMSRRREQGEEVSWLDAFGVLRSPSIGAILLLGLFLLGLFALWLGMADLIYRVTLGPDDPLSLAAFVHDTLYTNAGWAMIGIGIAVGFVFAALVLATSVVAFPLLLDRRAGAGTAIITSLRACAANPGPMAAWGGIVATALVIGSLPLLLGLIVVMPVLGHATWHLYRKLIVWK